MDWKGSDVALCRDHEGAAAQMCLVPYNALAILYILSYITISSQYLWIWMGSYWHPGNLYKSLRILNYKKCSKSVNKKLFAICHTYFNVGGGVRLRNKDGELRYSAIWLFRIQYYFRWCLGNSGNQRICHERPNDKAPSTFFPM
jgi:hypothetical protein